jgi:hypothetical protein
MNTRLAIVILAMLSCACSRKSESVIQVSPGYIRSKAQVENQVKEKPSVLDRIEVTGEPVMLSRQTLTSVEHVLASFGNEDDTDFLVEGTSSHAAFFFPEKGVRNDDLMRKVKDRYNVVAVMNRVVHAYEWFQRITSYSDDEDITPNQRDTIRWVLMSMPDISPNFLTSVLSPGEHRAAATGLLLSYNSSKGHFGKDSEFSRAFDRAVKAFRNLPEFATEEMLDEFEKGFWNWYDKRQFVPEIDDITRLSMHDYDGEYPDDEQIERLKRAVECEKDIDRRTILALELMKIGHIEGTYLLGDIIESGIYTRYLLEAWISWRANTQMDYSPSSFSVIPNNYYDMIRVKCINTILRHCQKEKDNNALCLLENLLEIDLLHRMASLLGNEALAVCANLSYNEFIDPRLLTDEE